ncbi:hypothetical protein GCM10010470_16490 [Saccharopolyspora taberi]|uniref:Uncharacterized protein n=1 Tax=Saccharopolyspora taberi TaxID=60895 RepID=A0ABN3V8E7_9PSEU
MSVAFPAPRIVRAPPSSDRSSSCTNSGTGSLVERIWTQPLKDRHNEITALLSYIDNDLGNWVISGCRVATVLADCPIERPRP